MKSMLMAIMTVAVAVTFSAPSFAGEDMKRGQSLVYGEEQKEKKENKKGGHADTFGDEKKKEER
ncbi:MAG: hypothetical protein ABL905_02650 [Nitrospiraceae bacterium]